MTKLNNLDFWTRLSEMAWNIFSWNVWWKVFELLKPNNNLEFYNCPKNIFMWKILKVYKTSIKKDKLKELFEYYNWFNELWANSLLISELENLWLFTCKWNNYEISEKYSAFILKYLFQYFPEKIQLQTIMLAYVREFESWKEWKLIDDILILSSLYWTKLTEDKIAKQIEWFRLTWIISY